MIVYGLFMMIYKTSNLIYSCVHIDRFYHFNVNASFIILQIAMKELCRYVHSSKIGYYSGGKFIPKIFYNFEFLTYISSQSLKV